MTGSGGHFGDRRTTDKGLGGKVVSIEERLASGDERMGKIEKDLAENTAATREVLEIISVGRSFFVVLGHIGNGVKYVAALGAAIGGAWAAWKHH
jgi:hypothetical protein